MRHFLSGFLIAITVISIGAVAVAQVESFKTPSSYVLQNYKLHPSTSGNFSLSNKQVADAAYYNQERTEVLRSELARAHREIQDLRRQVKELNDSLTQFKNYYFRQI